MNKREAYIGQIVFCKTAMNGDYIGELVEIVQEGRKPWRGRIRILAVAKFPQPMGSYGYHAVKRRPYEENSIHEFGGKNIHPYTDPIPNYHDSLIKALDKKIETVKTLIETSTSALVVKVEKEVLELLNRYKEEITKGELACGSSTE